MVRSLIMLGLSFLVAPILLCCGCGKPPALVNQYILEYPSPLPPAGAKTSSIDEAIKVERFLAAQPYDSAAMVYRPNPYTRESYTYNRWRVNPGTMIADYLARDLRNCGLFKAVFLAGSAGQSRFLLEGAVEEFQEIDEPDGWKGALALSVTLLDLNEDDITKKVIFQKNFRIVEPLVEKTPRGLAEGMSRAMSTVSAQVITDVYQAVKKRAESKAGAPKAPPRESGRRTD